MSGFVAQRHGLTGLLRRCFVEAAVDWHTVKNLEVEPYAWQRPPLTTTLTLRGEPLEHHLVSAISADVEALADVYERFIGGYIRRHKFRGYSVKVWFRQELGMQHAAAERLFTEPEFGTERRDLHLNLVQFAALVYHNHPCRLEEGADTFLVQPVNSELQFGVLNGQMVTNFNREWHHPIPVRFLWSTTGGLQDIACGSPVVPLRATLYDKVMRFTESDPGVFGEEVEAFRLALRTLWWRSGGRFPGRLWSLMLKDVSREALDEAVALARNFDNFSDPRGALLSIFVPQFLTKDQFQKLFGVPSRTWNGFITDRQRMRWTGALETLETMYFELR